MGLQIENVPYIRLAEQWGAGSSIFNDDDVITLNKPTGGKEYPAASGLVKRLTRSVHADSACSACYAALVRALYLAQQDGIAIPKKITIGQAWRGKTIPGIGIGNCCIGAESCVQGCPPSPESILSCLKI